MRAAVLTPGQLLIKPAVGRIRAVIPQPGRVLVMLATHHGGWTEVDLTDDQEVMVASWR